MKEGVMVLSCISAPGNKHSFSAQSWPLNGPLLHYGRLFYISPGNDEITTHSKFFQASSNRQNTQYEFFLSSQNDRANFVYSGTKTKTLLLISGRKFDKNCVCNVLLLSSPLKLVAL